MKRCFRCREIKSITEFARSSKNLDGVQSWCRECKKAPYRDSYARHRANVRRTVLEFDHVRGRKVASVGHMVRYGSSVQALKDEIAKCEVRCRNCHAIATLSRLPYSWHAVFQRTR